MAFSSQSLMEICVEQLTPAIPTLQKISFWYISRRSIERNITAQRRMASASSSENVSAEILIQNTQERNVQHISDNIALIL